MLFCVSFQLHLRGKFLTSLCLIRNYTCCKFIQLHEIKNYIPVKNKTESYVYNKINKREREKKALKRHIQFREEK